MTTTHKFPSLTGRPDAGPSTATIAPPSPCPAMRASRLSADRYHHDRNNSNNGYYIILFKIMNVSEQIHWKNKSLLRSVFTFFDNLSISCSNHSNKVTKRKTMMQEKYN